MLKKHKLSAARTSNGEASPAPFPLTYSSSSSLDHENLMKIFLVTVDWGNYFDVMFKPTSAKFIMREKSLDSAHLCSIEASKYFILIFNLLTPQS